MSKLTKILLILIAIILISATTLFLIGYFRPKNAGLLIQTNPSATVIIDGVQAGRTPYEITRKPATLVVKLVPDKIDKELKSYETRITLSSGIKTIINREFGETDETSSGNIISFEKIGSDEAEIAVISIPDEASVAIDGQVRGFAPYKISSITQGEHQLTVSKTGYIEKTLSVKTLNGYKLIVSVQLAESNLPAPTEEKPPEPKKQTMVEILSTPNGFLRVRSAASTASTEIARVNPGQQFLLIQEDAKLGWFEIEYQPETATSSAKQGWISNQYAKKIEAATSSAELKEQ
jgi:uncharacterized protein YgiM (DUF1202 family)